MDYIQSILVGFMQGLTEFLPVSSSAHIVLTQTLYKIFTGAATTGAIDPATTEEIVFDIVVHLGTLGAVILYFKNDISDLLKAFYTAVKNRDFSSIEAKICLYIILGTLITGVIALPLKDFTEHLVSTPYLVGLCLIITGCILFSSEKISQKFSKENEEIDTKKSVFIGIAQGLAVFPGFSRSGLTIATGLACGLTRVKAARYSFLLSLPIILGASCVYPIMEIEASQITQFNWGAIACGFLVSAITGYFCVKYFMSFLNKYSLNCFAYYCWIVGLLMFIFFNPHIL